MKQPDPTPLNEKNHSKLLNRIFILVIILLGAVNYSNTIGNFYSLDDYHISSGNDLIKQGFKAIPEIMTSLYASRELEDMHYGYRPVVRISFAIEYGIFGENNPKMPYISHTINLLLYILLALLIFQVLKRLFRNQSLYLPFLITLLFVAHPIHTEVVASLKNRDEILSLGFFLLSLQAFLKYADYGKKWPVFWGIIFYILAFLSKASIVSTILVFPLVFHFFTDMKPKKILIITGVMLLVAIVSIFGPYLYLPETSRIIRFHENPIGYQDDFLVRISTGLYGLLYYLRLLFYPHPLVYYYGYDMIPLTGPANPWVILSFLIYLGMFVYAVIFFRKKAILSFAFLFFLITMAPYSNIVAFPPGIIAERFLFFPSLPFILAIVYILFLVFRLAGKTSNAFSINTAIVTVIVLLLLIPSTLKTRDRNKDWNTQYTLFNADIKHLHNSVKANDLLADEIMRQVNRELSKPVDVTKFIKPSAERAAGFWKRALEIYPEHYSSWSNLGIAYNKIFKDYDQAMKYFKKAIEIKPDYGVALFNLGMVYENKGMRDSAMIMYEKCIELEPGIINPRSRLANLHFLKGDFRKALILNEEIIKLDPKETLPYLNFGNYYLSIGDTIKGIGFYEKAVEMGAPAQVSMFLNRYYRQKGDEEKAGFYFEKLRKASGDNPIPERK
ncbi:MAG: tetratricopeptide repeat protein [Bacteroidetes bacterium]|nr:tetratricopeptide repeat protein [Bacteroidota bacterium]